MRYSEGADLDTSNVRDARRGGGRFGGGRYRETVAAGELPEGVAAFAERRPPHFPWAG
ncbi:hypothetical protein [Blastococcus capsensis]|uniref:hypothetical protein n=1 Tax=Blastococcus capsensis TaxID=1564163 RepID=UPI00253FB37B|nr:hypothetical protein [Blastococcus capsensis]MDK3258212.1 hypothetical protein [Blastococcus capsensis]